jgi:cytidylate kinase
MMSEIKRYKQLYGIDFPDEKDFDIIIDTTNKSIEQVGDIILEKLR